MRLADFLVASFFSVIFTFVLIFLMLEVTKVVDEFLLDAFPDWGLLWNWEKARETIECLRPFGYVAFGIVSGLVVLGFIAGKGYFSTIGSIALYLPVFGYFALTMFFLAGIGVMRILWFPLLDLSLSLLRLGDVVYVPYLLLLLPFKAVGIDVAIPLSFIFMGVGILVFLWGVLAWLYGKFKGYKIIDFWIYKYSRHPQYLGFLLWSYGMLTLTTFISPKGGYVPSPSLPWLVSALTIVAVALYEEMQMAEKYGEKYMVYRDNTSFMLPLPKQLSGLITIPVKVLLKKSLPENKKELFYTITVYGAVLMLLSVPFSLV